MTASAALAACETGSSGGGGGERWALGPGGVTIGGNKTFGVRYLPDMNAEEAAAILEAIENMEREQRRQEALEAARQNAGGKKDW